MRKTTSTVTVKPQPKTEMGGGLSPVRIAVKGQPKTEMGGGLSPVTK